MRPPRINHGSQQDHFLAIPHCSCPICCAMHLHKSISLLRQNGSRPPPDVLQQCNEHSVTNSNLLSVPKGSQRLSLLPTPAQHNHSSHKAPQLERKDWATRRETPRFTLSLMQIWRLQIRGCISKLEKNRDRFCFLLILHQRSEDLCLFANYGWNNSPFPSTPNREAVSTYIILNIQVTTCFQQNLDNMEVTLVGSKMQGGPAMLRMRRK